MRGLVFSVICLVSAVVQAQQPSCPSGQCKVVLKPVDSYRESRGPLLGKRVDWQAGTSRGSVRRGPLGLWKTYSYSR